MVPRSILALHLCWILFSALSYAQDQPLPQDADVGLLKQPEIRPNPVESPQELVAGQPAPPPLATNNRGEFGPPVFAPQPIARPPSPQVSSLPRPLVPLPTITILQVPPHATATRSGFGLPSSSVARSISTILPSRNDASSASITTTIVSPFSTTLTTTVSTTMLIVATSSTNLTQGLPPLSTSDVIAVPTPSTVSEGMSDMAQLGVSFGVTFGVLTLAGAVSIYIWYRRRRAANNVEGDTDPPRLQGRLANLLVMVRRGNIERNDSRLTSYWKRLGAIFVSRRRKRDNESVERKDSFMTRIAKAFTSRKHRGNIDDLEWSIVSAEKVSIVKNVRAQSVRTMSRLNSSGSDESHTEGPQMSQQSITVLLESHPVPDTPSASAAAPPGAQTAAKETVRPVVEDPKPKSWPL